MRQHPNYSQNHQVYWDTRPRRGAPKRAPPAENLRRSATVKMHFLSVARLPAIFAHWNLFVDDNNNGFWQFKVGRRTIGHWRRWKKTQKGENIDRSSASGRYFCTLLFRAAARKCNNFNRWDNLDIERGAMSTRLRPSNAEHFELPEIIYLKRWKYWSK